MRDISHAELVSKTFKPGDLILEELVGKKAVEYVAGTPELKLELLHAAVGISGEAGELLDAVKKHVFYNQPLDVNNVIEELGDLKYFIEALVRNLSIRGTFTAAEANGWTGHTIIEDHNIDKLRKRYDKLTFTNEAAEARADKV